MSLPASDRDKRPDMRTAADLGAVLPKTAEVRAGRLFIGGVDMCALARQEGTPLYVFDEEDMRARMRAYRQSFRERFANTEVVYASKAFMNKEAARVAQDEGLGLDVSGGGELACALASGFPADRVLFHGNNKTPQELREAIGAGVGRIVIDSRIELRRISEIAGALGRTQCVLMRVTPGVEAATHEFIRTGCEDSKFGFTMRDDFAFTCVADVLAAPHVELAGFHCHIGSQIFDLSAFREAVRVMVKLASRVEKHYGIRVADLDMGGGLGVAYRVEDAPASIDAYADAVASSFLAECSLNRLEPPRLLVEPGRSLVAAAGVTLYTVGILKTLPQIRKYVAVDGGISDNIRHALYGASYEAVIADKAGEPRTEIVTVAGKHCESGDVVVVDGSLQSPALGDIVCVFGTGAYCHTMASNYNGQPRPAIAFVRDGAARTVTRRETYADLMARDV